MLMGHMDVVEAKPEDWSATHPFKMVEKDGYYYGRGTIDMPFAPSGRSRTSTS